MPPPEKPTAGVTINSTIQQILDYPGGEALLRNCLGAIMDHPMFGQMKGMTVPELNSASASVTDAMEACVKAGLAALCPT